MVLFGTEVEDSRNVGVFASGFASSPGSFFRRRWLRGGRRRSDGDFASESALVVDLIHSDALDVLRCVKPLFKYIYNYFFL